MSDEQAPRKAFWSESLEVAKVQIEVDGKTYPYTVVKQELAPDLPCFAGMPGGDHELLFISDELYAKPASWRDAVLIHEIECNLCNPRLQHLSQPFRCLTATAGEHERISPDEHLDYLMMRVAFYNGMLMHPTIIPHEPNEFRAQIEATRDLIAGQILALEAATSGRRL